MHIAVEAAHLKAALKHCAAVRVSYGTSTVALETSDGDLSIIAGWTEAVQCTLRATVKTGGVATLNTEALTDAVAALQGELTVDSDGSRCTIKSDAATITLPVAEESARHDKTKQLLATDPPAASAAGLQAAIMAASTVTSNDPSRPVLQTVWLRPDGDKIAVEATDSFYAVQIMLNGEMASEEPVLVEPELHKKLFLLDNVAIGSDGSTVVAVGRSTLSSDVGVKIVCAALQAEPPSLQGLRFDHPTVAANAETLVDALRTVKVAWADDTECVEVFSDGRYMTITARRTDIADGETVIPLLADDDAERNEVKLAMSASRLSTLTRLVCAGAENVVLGLPPDGRKPINVMAEGDDTKWAILMPIAIS